MEKNHKGRPPTKPVKLKEGYYIELRTKGAGAAIKIRRDTKDEIDRATKQYEKSKIVSYLGQVVEGKWIDGKNKGKKTVLEVEPCQPCWNSLAHASSWRSYLSMARSFRGYEGHSKKKVGQRHFVAQGQEFEKTLFRRHSTNLFLKIILPECRQLDVVKIKESNKYF